MSPLDALRELQSRKLVTVDDGEPCEAELFPALSRAEMERMQEAIGAALPCDIRELMEVAGGVAVDGEEVTWDGRAFGQECPGMFPRWLALMEDGAGNSWNIDIDPCTGAWGPVYYASHDPGVAVLQAGSLAEFIIQFADDCCQPERDGSLALVAERLAVKVWDRAGESLDASALRSSTDDVLRRAAERVGQGEVFDLRRARIGDGIAWGRLGRGVTLVRPGPEAVWAAPRSASRRRWWGLVG